MLATVSLQVFSPPSQGMVLSVKRSVAHGRHTLLAQRLREAVEAGLGAQYLGSGTALKHTAGMHASDDPAGVLKALAAYYDSLGLEAALAALSK